ncbi:M1 family metallopeptidase [Mucilaginibacter arboris]|uniref:M1 family peptidase n=1 Tax=Mucilaginibacter arboris TaxID=2682090 RepID=A0A7K1SXU3_9SPHI|nr:M1 family metallopeptidase [Mucilaginibacter arboris]MVN22151.1 M1 family peptidase [Mucilaginibacter arboris]
MPKLNSKFLSVLLSSVVFLVFGCKAQKLADTIKYNHQDLFGPINWPVPANQVRSANGSPGPQYWQNKVDYNIHAILSEKDTSINSKVVITYTNNSPDKLDYLWLQLDQNLFKPDSRGAAATPIAGDRFDVKGFSRGGYHIASVTITYKNKSYTVKPVITDARMQLRLNEPVNANGDKIQIEINYDFAIPLYGADRMGRLKTRNGYIYEVAQWYPRMCVYDDVEGWNTLPYMGLGEFYCEYGNFDYFITAPADMLVFGSGDLQNPAEVLTKTQISRLETARKSDQTVMIVDKDEIGKPETHLKQNGTLIWHFNMKNSRDVAWAASKAFMWDAAKVNLPSGRKAISQSAYPVESSGNNSWGRSTEYLKNSIEIYSKAYIEYPWNSAVSISGVALGMEYPGIIFCLNNLKNENLWGDVTHEIGHNWFPMIVGSNERKFMWQDEGFNTFINQYASEQFNNGEYYHPANRPSKVITRAMQNNQDPLMTPPEAMNMNDYGLYYIKTSLCLDMLRNVVLGPDRFDYAFHTYINRWALKHPQPYDFFRTMNDASGEDLNWFWKEWFFTTWKLDQVVTDVKYVLGTPSKGSLITIENREKIAMPVDLQITQENGKVENLHLPVEIWQRGGTWTFKYPSVSRIQSVVIDPDLQLPDINRSNNNFSDKRSTK